MSRKAIPVIRTVMSVVRRKPSLYPVRLMMGPNPAALTIIGWGDDFKSPYAYHFNVGVQRQLRDIAAARMTPEAVAAAAGRIASWRPRNAR